MIDVPACARPRVEARSLPGSPVGLRQHWWCADCLAALPSPEAAAAHSLPDRVPSPHRPDPA